MATSSSSFSQTLDRGLQALQVLAAAQSGLTVSELAGALGTHRAAVYRLLGPLADHGLVRREDASRYVLGPGLIELAAGVQQRLREVAAPVLQELADRLPATTALTIRDGDEAVVASVFTPRSPNLHLTYRPGLRHPLTQGSPGHVLLAARPAHAGEPDFVTRARAQGWAVSSGELLPGATGVAVAVAGPGHEPEASISAVWIAGFEAEAVAVDVIAAARAIAAALWG